MRAKLYEHIKHVQGPRHYQDSYEGMAAAQAYITTQLEQLGYQVDTEEFYVAGCVRPFYNLSCRVGTALDRPPLLIGCHYDTVAGSPGANDNASGLAAMLCLAELLKPLESKIHIYFLFFTLEERNPGLTAAAQPDPLDFGTNALIGSTRWAEDHPELVRSAMGMIDFDSIGYAREEPHTHKFIPGTLELCAQLFSVDAEQEIGNFIVLISNQCPGGLHQAVAEHAKKENLPFALITVPAPYETVAQSMPALLYADHAAFWKRGVPCLFVTDTGSEQRYPYEHTPLDTAEQLNYAFMEKIVRVFAASIPLYFDEGR